MLTCTTCTLTIVLLIAVKVLGMLHYTLIPSHCISSWHWETFIQSSCQIVQFFRSKNKQKGDQFFYQLSDFCENCNPHSSYILPYHHRWWMFGWYSIWRNMKLTLFTCLKIFCRFEKIRVYCMLKLAVWACNFVCNYGCPAVCGQDKKISWISPHLPILFKKKSSFFKLIVNQIWNHI